MDEEIAFYVIFMILVIGFFILFLNRVLKVLSQKGFVKPQKINENNLISSQKNNETSLKNIKLYEKFCDEIGKILLNIKNEASDDKKEIFSDLLRELSLVQGQNSNEAKMQKNIFNFLQNLESAIKQTFGEEKAQNIKNELGLIYNQLFSHLN